MFVIPGEFGGRSGRSGVKNREDRVVLLHDDGANGSCSSTYGASYGPTKWGTCTEAGTLVAFISGINNLNAFWSDLANWFQGRTVNNARYQTFVDAMKMFAKGGKPIV